MGDGAQTRDGILGLSVPIWFWKERAGVQEAEATLEMAESENEWAKNKTILDVQTLHTKFQTALRLVQLYDSSIIPQAEQALKVTEAAYQANRASFLDLLDASRSLLTYKQEYYHILGESEIALANLEQMVGTDLTEE